MDFQSSPVPSGPSQIAKPRPPASRPLPPFYILMFAVFGGKCPFRLRTHTKKVELPRKLFSLCLQFVGKDFGNPVEKAIQQYKEFESPSWFREAEETAELMKELAEARNKVEMLLPIIEKAQERRQVVIWERRRTELREVKQKIVELTEQLEAPPPSDQRCMHNASILRYYVYSWWRGQASSWLFGFLRPRNLRLLLKTIRFPQDLLNEFAKHTWSQPTIQFQFLLAGAKVSEDMYSTRFNKNITSRRLLRLSLSCWWPRITQRWNFAMTGYELKDRVDYTYTRMVAKESRKKLQRLFECTQCDCTQ